MTDEKEKNDIETGTSTEFESDAQSAADDAVSKAKAYLNKEDEEGLSAQQLRILQREEEENRRVQKAIEGTKSNPAWFVPLICFFLVVGLIWIVTYYLTSKYPIPTIGNWNLTVGFGIMFVGFVLCLWWR